MISSIISLRRRSRRSCSAMPCTLLHRRYTTRYGSGLLVNCSHGQGFSCNEQGPRWERDGGCRRFEAYAHRHAAMSQATLLVSCEANMSTTRTRLRRLVPAFVAIPLLLGLLVGANMAVA